MLDTAYSTFFSSVSITSTSADASANVIYTVPANYDSEIDFLICTNGSSTNNISIQIYHANGTSYHHLLRNHSVGGNDSYKVLESDRIYLHEGDKVLAYKGSGTFDVSVSGRQFYNPMRSI
jgi:hypothetical protein